MKPNRFENKNRPLCKFGPGGEYVSTWPGNGKDYSEKNCNSLSKVLSTIAGILGAAINADLLGDMERQVQVDALVIQTIAVLSKFALPKSILEQS